MATSPPQIVLPLFLVLIGATTLGVLLGGFAVWLRQGRHRKALRDAKGKIEVLRGEKESLRAQIKASSQPSTALVPPRSAA